MSKDDLCREIMTDWIVGLDKTLREENLTLGDANQIVIGALANMYSNYYKGDEDMMHEMINAIPRLVIEFISLSE